MSRTWKCQRQTLGKKCGTQNPLKRLYCIACGKKRPPTKRPEHLKALDIPYEDYVALNGGEFCAVCLRAPSSTRRLDRDHCHQSGKPRGLLCAPCNRALHDRVTPAWLRAAADYLERSAA